MKVAEDELFNRGAGNSNRQDTSGKYRYRGYTRFKVNNGNITAIVEGN